MLVNPCDVSWLWTLFQEFWSTSLSGVILVRYEGRVPLLYKGFVVDGPLVLYGMSSLKSPLSFTPVSRDSSCTTHVVCVFISYVIEDHLVQLLKTGGL